jgi:hypothetical protein
MYSDILAPVLWRAFEISAGLAPLLNQGATLREDRLIVSPA